MVGAVGVCIYGQIDEGNNIYQEKKAANDVSAGALGHWERPVFDIDKTVLFLFFLIVLVVVRH